METMKLYEKDAYQKTFTAQVQSCRQAGKNWEVILDRTCFYPEGGGQPGDHGTLGQAQVLDVQIRDGIIQHMADRPLEEGSAVSGEIDWSRRFDLMQQHSGEHILSGLVHRNFGYDNVGFHMGADVVTVDWNGLLTREDLAELETQANQVIWQNRETEIFVPSREELKTLDYRSKKELDWPVRIVRFPGADTCACCGTHVSRAGEIGLIKVLSVVRMRHGVRVEMLSGRRALEYCTRIQEENHKTSVLLSAKETQTAAYVQRLYDEHQALKARWGALETAHCASIAEQYRDRGDCLLFAEGLDTNSVRRLAAAVMETCGGKCAVFSRGQDGSYAWCLGEKNGDVRPLVKAMNQALHGRGGGKPNFAQGAAQARKQEIVAFFQGNGFRV